MNEGLISNWNSKVGHEDLTYVLGDVFFCQVKEAHEIMHRLNGKKILIAGNHDKLIRNQVPLQNLFEKVYWERHSATIDGTYVVMDHYPLLSWEKASRGSFMLHGHCHNNIAFDPKCRRLDVGVDAQNYSPISWKEVQRKLSVIDPNDSRDR